MARVDAFDRDIAQYIATHRTAALTHVAHVATAAGSEVSVALLSALTIGLLLFRFGRVRAAAVFTAGMAGSVFLTLGVKLLVGRQRPGTHYRLGPPDSSYSFPSGHTLNTTVFLLMLVLALWPVVPRSRHAVMLAVAALASVTVGLSRLYLGYHWATDVLGALVIGVVWSAIVVRLSLSNLGTALTGPEPSTAPPARQRS
ncbi:MAG: phosphatase PAP2 family protein [Marmoricola sp.]